MIAVKIKIIATVIIILYNVCNNEVNVVVNINSKGKSKIQCINFSFAATTKDIYI